MVKAKWWHRLLLVLIAAGALIIAVVSLMLVHDSSREAVYKYSWRGDLPAGEGSECSVSIYSYSNEASIYCGQFQDPSAVLEDMARHGLIDRAKIPAPRTEINDGVSLQQVSASIPLAYEVEHVFRLDKAWKPLGIAVGVLFGYLLIASLFFKVLLWIVHGDTDLQP